MNSFISIRYLANNTSKVINSIDDGPKVVTYHGRPVAVILPIDEDKIAQVLADADLLAD